MLRRVCIVGSGNWGSAISKVIGKNVLAQPALFHPQVNIWVYEEVLPDGRKLSDVINREHVNVKYLPGIELPANVVAVPDLVDAAKEADLLVFVVPHQFIKGICGQLAKGIKSTAIGGLDVEAMGLKLISKLIEDALGIDVSVLSGANIADEVAREHFCESTLGYRSDASVQPWLALFHTPRFRVSAVKDPYGVELCGALKNIVALGAGFADGLDCGANTKAAIIRIGLLEICHFCRHFCRLAENIDRSADCPQMATFFESCGVADLITTCFGGRNRRIAEAMVRTGRSIPDLEAELLNGQKLQGPSTCHEAVQWLRSHALENEFPLFGAIHRICFEGADPHALFENLS